MNLFDWFNRNDVTEENLVYVRDMAYSLQKRVKLLEKHLGVEYFDGGKNKPHYRSKRVRKSN